MKVIWRHDDVTVAERVDLDVDTGNHTFICPDPYTLGGEGPPLNASTLLSVTLETEPSDISGFEQDDIVFWCGYVALCAGVVLVCKAKGWAFR